MQPCFKNQAGLNSLLPIAMITLVTSESWQESGSLSGLTQPRRRGRASSAACRLKPPSGGFALYSTGFALLAPHHSFQSDDHKSFPTCKASDSRAIGMLEGIALTPSLSGYCGVTPRSSLRYQLANTFSPSIG
jgi:hypothetical protein